MSLYYRLYIYSLHELLIIYKYLDKHFKKSFIRVNKSSVTAPILLTHKFKRGIYIYVDYRGLNNVTVKNRYPIPLIRETFDILYYVKIYIKLDIIAIFNRLYITPKDK